MRQVKKRTGYVSYSNTNDKLDGHENKLLIVKEVDQILSTPFIDL